MVKLLFSVYLPFFFSSSSNSMCGFVGIGDISILLIKNLSISCILSPCLFSLYAEYIMRNTELDEAQAGIKIAGRNINNLRYAGNTTLLPKARKN